MLLLHPGVAKIDCRDCQRRLYDLETGEPKYYRAGPNREKRYYDGPKHKPPCATPEDVGGGCPKGSPQEAHKHELTEENWRTWELYQQSRATHGQCLTEAERSDVLLPIAFSLLERITSAAERRAAANETAAALLPLLARRL